MKDMHFYMCNLDFATDSLPSFESIYVMHVFCFILIFPHVKQMRCRDLSLLCQ